MKLYIIQKTGRNASERPAGACHQKKCSRLSESNFVGFANFERHGRRFGGTAEAVIPHKCSDVLLLPSGTVQVLKTQGIIFWEKNRKIIGKFFIWWHCKVFCPSVISIMLRSSSVQIVCSSDFQHIIPVNISIMSDVKIFFLCLHLVFYRLGSIKLPLFPFIFSVFSSEQV